MITNKTTYYLGNYEKIKLANGDITELHYIAGGDGLAAIHVITTPNTQPSSPTTYYTYTDHLGSILTLTNQNANIVYEQNFDAWGRERNVDDWTYSNTEPFVETGYDFSWLTRGYTGHEHLSEFGLINMNGRLYDPILGRMLSPDNYVQDATSTQGYNRYSYVYNNPLKFTDPSGENPFLIAAIIGAIIGIIIGNEIANSVNAKGFDRVLYIIAGAVIGGVSGYLGAGVAGAGGIFANTSAIAAGSFSSAVGFKILSGGRSDVSIGLGSASYNIDKNDWGYLGEKGNSSLEDFGYTLGALANISDVVNIYDASVAAQRAQMTQAEKDAQLKNYKDWKLNGKNKFLGPTGDVDPRVVRASGVDPNFGVDEFAYGHDVAYYDKGADGFRSALFSTNTLVDDIALVQGALSVPISFASGAVSISFGGLVIFKSSFQYSYWLNTLGR